MSFMKIKLNCNLKIIRIIRWGWVLGLGVGVACWGWEADETSNIFMETIWSIANDYVKRYGYVTKEWQDARLTKPW